MQGIRAIGDMTIFKGEYQTPIRGAWGGLLPHRLLLVLTAPNDVDVNWQIQVYFMGNLDE